MPLIVRDYRMSEPEFSDEDINEWFGDYNRDTGMSDLIARLRGTSMAYTESGNDAYVAHITKEAADKLEQATRWNSIESAPKDGTEIFGWREDCGHLLIRWDCAESFLTESEIEAGGWNDDNLFQEDWFCADFVSGSRLDGSEAPTHWMPLPQFAGDSGL